MYSIILVFSYNLINYIFLTHTFSHILNCLLYYIFQENIIFCITHFRVELFRTLMCNLIVIMVALFVLYCIMINRQKNAKQIFT